ncbi:unnamed protein product, partial [Symbiodinium microadriaticum]
ARVGSVIHAWDGNLGKELWQRAQIELPRLPTLPTYLQLDSGVLYVGAGSFLLALRTEDAALLFMTSLPGSLLKLYTSPEPQAAFAALLRSDTYALAHISPSKGELFAPRLGTAVERVSRSLSWRWMVVLAVVFDGDRGGLHVRDVCSSRWLWQRTLPNIALQLCIVQSQDVNWLCVGGVGFVWALHPDDGRIL